MLGKFKRIVWIVTRIFRKKCEEPFLNKIKYAHASIDLCINL